MIARIFSFFPAAIAVLLLHSCASGVQDGGIPPVSDSSQAGDGDLIATDRTAYLLGEGDKIGIQVFDEPDLTMEANVSSSGSINYSYLGDIRVAGKSPVQLERDITELLKNGFLVNPSVNVSVVQFRPFFIAGEVSRPGSYPFQPALTLDKAIALAGGLTDRASTRRMFVVRAGSSSAGEKKISLSTEIGPGDTITIRQGFF